MIVVIVLLVGVLGLVYLSEEKEAPENYDEMKDEGVGTVVLKMESRRESCAKKDAVKGYKGVQSVKRDCAVVGKVDPVKMKGRLEEKTKKKVELISPQPKKDAAAGGGDKKPEEKKPEEKKPEEKKPPKEEKKPEKKKAEEKKPPKEEKKAEEKKPPKEEKKAEEKKPPKEEKKPKEKKPPKESTVVLKIRLHPEICLKSAREHRVVDGYGKKSDKGHTVVEGEKEKTKVDRGKPQEADDKRKKQDVKAKEGKGKTDKRGKT